MLIQPVADGVVCESGNGLPEFFGANSVGELEQQQQMAAQNEA